LDFGTSKTPDFMSDKIRALGRNSRLTGVAFPPGFNPTPDQLRKLTLFEQILKITLECAPRLGFIF
jgi:hypothetical protein